MTHTGEKPHACVFESCEWKFATSGNLATHMMTHTGEKPHACVFEGCGHKCTSTGNLATHMMTHTGEKPHSCVFEECGYKCTTSGQLVIHMRTHTGEKPYACVFEGCGYECTTSGALKAHKYRMHGIGDGPTCAICKSRGVKFEGMSCIDCRLEHGTSNRGARERWVEQGLRGHEDVRLGNYSSHDKSLPCGGTSKKYRPDFLWIVSRTTPSFWRWMKTSTRCMTKNAKQRGLITCTKALRETRVSSTCTLCALTRTRHACR